MANLFGEFGTEGNNFACGLFFEPPSLAELFRNVIFSPGPHAIKLKNSISVKDGNLEIHFRDPNHLRVLLEEFPSLNANQIYFVQDAEIEDGKEFIHVNGAVTVSKFVHVMSDSPLKVSGDLSLPYSMFLPLKSDFNDLSARMEKGGINIGIAGYEEGMLLANTLENFDPNILGTKTQEGLKLFEERKRNREEHPENYPKRLADICPKRFVLSDGHVVMNQKDYLHSESPIIYIAPSTSEIADVKTQLIPFRSGGINFINPYSKDKGIYAAENIYLKRGIELISDKNLLLAGEIVMPDYNLSIIATQGIWHFGTINASGIYIRSNNFNVISLATVTSKPEKLPLRMWLKLQEFLLREYSIVFRPNTSEG